MRKIFIQGFIFFLLFNLTSALGCQYKENVINSTETKFLPFDKEGTQLREVDIEFNSDWNQPLKITNLNDYSMNITLKINLNIKSVTWCNGYSNPLNYILTKEIIIPKNNFVEIPVEKPVANYYCKDFRWTEPYEIQYQENNEIDVKPVEIIHTKEICKTCPNEKICLDNGSSCGFNNECGSGVCNPAKKCGEFDGICPEGKILKENICVNSFFTKLKSNSLWFGLIILIFLASFYYYNKKNILEKVVNKNLKKLEEELKQKRPNIEKIEELDKFESWVRGKCLIKTNGKEKVQSYGEKLIYNFLLKHNIHQDYDKQITLNGLWCRPDFYLTEHGIVIEYWGVEGDVKYDNNMEKKKRSYKEAGIGLISIYKKDVVDDDKFEIFLKEKLMRIGIKIYN